MLSRGIIKRTGTKQKYQTKIRASPPSRRREMRAGARRTERRSGVGEREEETRATLAQSSRIHADRLSVDRCAKVALGAFFFPPGETSVRVCARMCVWGDAGRTGPRRRKFYFNLHGIPREQWRLVTKSQVPSTIVHCVCYSLNLITSADKLCVRNRQSNNARGKQITLTW